MRTDLSEQIHDLMEHGVRPVTLTDIQRRAPRRAGRLQHAAAGSPLSHGRLVLAGAAVVVISAVVVMAALLPGSGSGAGSGKGIGGVRLAAWTVTRQSDGSLAVTLRELPDPAKLQQKLRADGIPAKVLIQRPKPIGNKGEVMPTGDHVPGCHIYPQPDIPDSLWYKIFYGPHTGAPNYNFWVYPQAIPPGRGVVVVVVVGSDKLSNAQLPVGNDAGYGVNDFILELANATPQCTGS